MRRAEALADDGEPQGSQQPQQPGGRLASDQRPASILRQAVGASGQAPLGARRCLMLLNHLEEGRLAIA